MDSIRPGWRKDLRVTPRTEEHFGKLEFPDGPSSPVIAGTGIRAYVVGRMASDDRGKRDLEEVRSIVIDLTDLDIAVAYGVYCGIRAAAETEKRLDDERLQRKAEKRKRKLMALKKELAELDG